MHAFLVTDSVPDDVETGQGVHVHPGREFKRDQINSVYRMIVEPT